MRPADKSWFIRCYTRVLTQAWSSDQFSQRLEENPREVLAEMGLETTPNAEIEIVRSRGAGPDLTEQLSLWAEGFRSGRFVLFVPHLPQMDLRDLNEVELGDLAGGEGSFCCSPCCCQSLDE